MKQSMEQWPFKEGQKVRAVKVVTEGGLGFDGDPKANIGIGANDRTFIPSNFIHATPGDIGVVVFVDEIGLPTVRFERTGTATMVGHEEIEEVW